MVSSGFSVDPINWWITYGWSAIGSQAENLITSKNVLNLIYFKGILRRKFRKGIRIPLGNSLTRVKLLWEIKNVYKVLRIEKRTNSISSGFSWNFYVLGFGYLTKNFSLGEWYVGRNILRAELLRVMRIENDCDSFAGKPQHPSHLPIKG